MDNEYIWIRIRRRIADTLVWILRGASMEPHNQAARIKDPGKNALLRQEGDDIHRTAEEIKAALRGEPLE